MARRFQHLHTSNVHHTNAQGHWCYQGSDYKWYRFDNDEHFANTVAARYPVAFFLKLDESVTQIPDAIRGLRD